MVAKRICGFVSSLRKNEVSSEDSFPRLSQLPVPTLGFAPIPDSGSLPTFGPSDRPETLGPLAGPDP